MLVSASDPLGGDRAVVVGGGSGIGASVSRHLSAAGARVAIIDLDPEAAAGVAGEIDGWSAAADVTDPAGVAYAIDAAAEALGGLTLACNAAGTSSQSPLARWDPVEWSRLVSVNLHGIYHCMRAEVPHVLAAGGGAIVNVASVNAIRPAAGEGPYAAAKAGVIALSSSAALEYGPMIRVDCVSPDMILTPLTEPSFVTGQNIVVDGGLTLHGGAIDGIFDRLFPA